MKLRKIKTAQQTEWLNQAEVNQHILKGVNEQGGYLLFFFNCKDRIYLEKTSQK